MSDEPTTGLKFIEETCQGDQAALGLDRIPGLRGADTGGQLEFTFDFQGYVFAVRADARQQQTHMSFRANLGSLPYTAENLQARASAMTILRAASRALGGRVRMTPRQRIILSEEMRFSEPLTPILLMSRSARLLLQAKPYLDLLSQYVSPPVDAAA